MWFDSHCHLDLPGFEQAARPLWASAQAQGVTRAFVPGVEPEQWPNLAALRALPGIVTGAGIHPFALERWSQQADEHNFDILLQQALVALTHEVDSKHHVAIGECGWDKPLAKRNPRVSLELQTQVVLAHIQLAQQTALPLVLHVVQTHGLALQVLEANRVPSGGVIHSYSGPADLVSRYHRLGFRLAFGPALLRHGTHPKVVQALRATARDYLVIETDAPLPKRWSHLCANSPAAVIAVGHVAAQMLHMPVENLAAQTERNTTALFNSVGS